MTKTLREYLPFLILLITISSINQWSYYPIGNTYIWWGVYASILLSMFIARKLYFNPANKQLITVIKWYLLWNIVSIIRGLFVADNYWEWKNLVGTSMVLLLPLSIYISTHPYIIQKVLSTWLKYALPVFFVFLFFIKGEAIGRYLIPISFLLIFFPIIDKKYKLLLIFFSLFVFAGDLSARSNLIKFIIPFSFSLLYYLRFFIRLKFLEIFRLFLIISPIIIFGLGVTGVFNIFKMEEYISGSYTTTTRSNGELKEENLIADTRSLIYTEVLSSAIKNNYIWIGRTPARGNDSDAYGAHAFEELKTGKMERFSNEVSILNILTWTGLVGVILYFFVFYKASYLAINRSNNIFLPIMGLYIAFRWAYAWVEDFSQFDLSYFFLWVMIGMCFSQSFREMTDRDIRYWVLGIFNKRYRRSVVKQQEQVNAEVAVAR